MVASNTCATRKATATREVRTVVDQATIREDFEARGRDHALKEQAEKRFITLPEDIQEQIRSGNFAGHLAWLKGWSLATSEEYWRKGYGSNQTLI